MSVTTIKVSNLSLGASERDIKEFFSFSGDIAYVEMMSDTERSQIAYVTFKDVQGAETAVLLSACWDILGSNWSMTRCPNVTIIESKMGIITATMAYRLSNNISGATIVDMSVSITLAPDYELPPDAIAPSATENKTPGGDESAFRKAEDVVSGMLAKGFLLGKDAVNKAKGFDEKHQLTSTASEKVASFDKKIGLSEKISAGTSAVSGKVREVDQKFQVSEKTKSAFAAAEQTVSSAGSAIMKNRPDLPPPPVCLASLTLPPFSLRSAHTDLPSQPCDYPTTP
ncbi:hypothetical protein C1H46_015554 [Malus baccata]|uniref:RRM domain-containing protein n=1 Tax=Malus baccata TaxID=106549 RepID=A0A540MJF9_MALBA|nr:hypothetical protein C1H46_015554 [Malus baccata]